MKVTFSDINNEYSSICERAFGKPDNFPFETKPSHFGGYHIEISDDGSISLIGTDRGIVTVRKKTNSLNELMFWVFSDFAYSKGWEYELKHRHPTDDSRRIVFPKALDFIEKISPEWRGRLKAEQEEILRNNPFRDDPFRDRK